MFKILRNKRGQNTLEYILMLAMVAGIIITVGHFFSGKISDLTSQVGSKISDAVRAVSGNSGN